MIPNYWWRTHKVLPTTYDESLSYYEVLNKITYYINQVIKSIEEFEKTTTQQVTNISELVTNIRNDVDELNTRFSALEVLTGQHTTQINTNTTDITSLKTRTTTLENRTTTQAGEISTLGQQISDVDAHINNIESVEYIMVNFANLQDEITFDGSVDYTQISVLYGSNVQFYYQFGGSRRWIKPFSQIIKRGNDIKILIKAEGGMSSAVTLSKTLRITVDGVSKLTLSSIPYTGTSATYTLTLSEADFNSTLKFHNIDIFA